MTVKEMIEKLKEFPEDAEVVFYQEYYWQKTFKFEYNTNSVDFLDPPLGTVGIS